MSRNRVYGLTVRQWLTLLAVIFAVIVLGCRFCYTSVEKYVSPTNSNETAVENKNAGKKRTPSRTSPSTSLSIEQATERYLRLGNPSAANNSDPNNFLMVNPAYAVSYNRSRGTANWVAWTITRADIGDAERSNDFRPNPDLPKSFPRITPSDYTGSGFDRGHLCPSKDRSNAPDANSRTFLMTNIVPQAPDSNQGVWKNLEDYSRDLVFEGNDVYVIAGVTGERGRLKNKITIPATTWKIIVVLPENFDSVSDLKANAQVIAVDIPNQNGIKNDDWRKYRVTVRQIEQKTGLNLFAALPPNIQEPLKTKMDGK